MCSSGVLVVFVYLECSLSYHFKKAFVHCTCLDTIRLLHCTVNCPGR